MFVNLKCYSLSSPRALPRDTELSGWSVYDFHEEFARQQVRWFKTNRHLYYNRL